MPRAKRGTPRERRHRRQWTPRDRRSPNAGAEPRLRAARNSTSTYRWMSGRAAMPGPRYQDDPADSLYQRAYQLLSSSDYRAAAQRFKEVQAESSPTRSISRERCTTRRLHSTGPGATRSCGMRSQCWTSSSRSSRTPVWRREPVPGGCSRTCDAHSRRARDAGRRRGTPAVEPGRIGRGAVVRSRGPVGSQRGAVGVDARGPRDGDAEAGAGPGKTRRVLDAASQVRIADPHATR